MYFDNIKSCHFQMNLCKDVVEVLAVLPEVQVETIPRRALPLHPYHIRNCVSCV